MAVVQINSTAYVKVLLHGAKFGAQAVGGLLLGESTGSGEFVVKDALPVYHGNPVGPVFEVMWALFEAQTAWKGLRVVGVYFAHEDVNGNSKMPPVFIETLLQAVRVKSSNSELVLLELDGNLINSANDLCLVPSGKSVKTIAPLDTTVAKLNAAVDQLLHENKHRQLHDVDDHLESGASVANLFV